MCKAAQLTIAAIVLLPAAAAADSAADEQAVLDASARAREASRVFDVEKLDPLLAPDFLAIDPSGEIRGKAAFLGMMRAVPSELRAASTALKVVQSEVLVRQYGDTAVLTERRDVDTAPARSSARYTQVWVRQGGTWRLTTFQVTRIAAAAEDRRD